MKTIIVFKHNFKHLEINFLHKNKYYQYSLLSLTIVQNKNINNNSNR